MPEADAAAEAGKLIEKLPELWSGASDEERRRILMTMLDAVYVETKEEKADRGYQAGGAVQAGV